MGSEGVPAMERLEAARRLWPRWRIPPYRAASGDGESHDFLDAAAGGEGATGSTLKAGGYRAGGDIGSDGGVVLNGLSVPFTVTEPALMLKDAPDSMATVRRCGAKVMEPCR